MRLLTLTSIAAALTVVTNTAHAAILSVSGPASSAGTMAEIIAAPASVTNTAQFNTGLQGFNEMQGVVLPSAIAVAGGIIDAGTRVDSHMIFLNKQNGVGGTLSHQNVQWEFSGDILGVMIDVGGLNEAASTSILGALGTTYASFANRGLEGNDSVMISGAILTTSFFVTQPGDWIRVITAAPEVPLPAALPLMVAGLGALGGFSRRRKKTA